MFEMFGAPDGAITKYESRFGGSFMTSNKGFTLVEILIVVIILGILAAIVIPQFSSASQDARESSLTSDLQTLRSQLELYNIQHNDHYPNVKSADSGATWTDDAANFAAKMTSQTDQYGNIVANGTAGAFGPYMQSFPNNAVSGKTGVRVGVLRPVRVATPGTSTPPRVGCPRITMQPMPLCKPCGLRLT